MGTTLNSARASARISLRIAQAGQGCRGTALTPRVSQGTNTTASVGSLTTLARGIATTLRTPTSDAFRGMLVAAARMETTLSGQASLCGSTLACRKLCSLLVQFSLLNGACRIRYFMLWLHIEPQEHHRAYVPAITPSSLASSPGFPSDFAAHMPAGAVCLSSRAVEPRRAIAGHIYQRPVCTLIGSWALPSVGGRCRTNVLPNVRKRDGPK